MEKPAYAAAAAAVNGRQTGGRGTCHCGEATVRCLFSTGMGTRLSSIVAIAAGVAIGLAACERGRVTDEFDIDALPRLDVEVRSR